MTIRPAQPSDEKQVVELVRTILDQEFPADRAAYTIDDLEQLAQSYGGRGSGFLVAEEGNRIVGTCGIKAESDKRAMLRRFFVEPSSRRQGVGSALLKEAVSFCRSHSFREIVISTSTRMEQAIRLCRALGFKEDGRWSMGEITLIRFHLRLTG